MSCASGAARVSFFVRASTSITMEFGPEDLLEFGRYYLSSLLWSVFACVVVLIAGVLVVRLRPERPRLGTVMVCLAAVPLVGWVVYFAATSKLTYTLVLLGSESSGVAERTYFTRLKEQVTTLDRAVRLAVTRRNEPNVRFYACCLIADMLQTNTSAAAEAVLKRVENADAIQTQFFGGNRLTDGFYVPGHAQVDLPVREIVERRIRMLRNGSQSSL
jgi:hypothetical protein